MCKRLRSADYEWECCIPHCDGIHHYYVMLPRRNVAGMVIIIASPIIALIVLVLGVIR